MICLQKVAFRANSRIIITSGRTLSNSVSNFPQNQQVRTCIAQRRLVWKLWRRICLDLRRYKFRFFPEGLMVKIMWILLCVDPLQMCPQQHRCPVNDACVWWYKPSRQQRFVIANHHSSKWSFHYYSFLHRFSNNMARKLNQVMSANLTLQV